MADACIFCRIAAGEIPATVVHETPDTLAFRDINPRSPVHVLVIPRRHVDSIAALGPEDQELAGVIMWVPGGLFHLAAALVFLARALTPERLADGVGNRDQAA